MKIRNGFVSNSSSSSFIVGFKKKPKTVEELKKLMFEDEKYVKQYNYSLSTQEAAERVFSDMHGAKPLTKSQMFKEFNSGWFDGHPEMNYWGTTESDRIRDEFYKKFPKESKNLWAPEKIKNKDAQALARKCIAAEQDKWDADKKQIDDAAKKMFETKVIPTMKGYKVFAFTYSDNDGEIGCIMEHGDIFSRLPHFRISHH